MEKAVNILYINGNIMKRGGIESFMMNYFRHIDSQRVHIDFVVHGYEKGVYDDEIEAAGSQIYHVPIKSKHPIKYANELRKIFSLGKYQIVHSHCDAISGWILKIAAESGISVRIAHSHNTATLTTNRLKLALNEHYRKMIPKYATHMFACSEDAGKWLFGKKAKFEVITNAIEIDKFRFNNIKRKKIRQELGIQDKFVIGHVGRFDFQKNQELLLQVLSKLVRINKNICLVLVGVGDDLDRQKKYAEDLKIKENVLFLGSRADVQDIYNCFDIFALPSRFEGLGIVAIEAQANGLPCLLSNHVPKIVKLNENVEFLPIENESVWIDRIQQYKCTTRDSVSKEIPNYDININAKLLEDKYCLYVRKNES